MHIVTYVNIKDTKPTASWKTPPTPPTVSSSSYHQEDGTGASEPAPPDCSTAFSPRLWEPWTQITPPPLKPHANPLPPETWTTPLTTPPNLTTPKKIGCWIVFLCNSSVLHTGEWACTKPPVAAHSPLCTRHFSHTAVCTQSHKRLSNICMFTCSCTTNHLVLFPSQLLDSQCFSLHMYSIMWSNRIVCIFYLLSLVV